MTCPSDISTCATPLVIVTSGGVTTHELARAVIEVVANVPDDVDVAVITERALTLVGQARRKTRVVRVSGESEARAQLARSVAEDRLVIVADARLRLSGEWFATALETAAHDPEKVAAFTVHDSLLLVYPPRCQEVGGHRADHPATPDMSLRNPVRLSRSDALTAVMIVKDEIAVIEKSIAATMPFVDEVVVYDTGSSDGTQEAARRSGARVVQGYWDNSFANARNRAAEESRTDWILVVDADECPTGDPTALRRLIRNTKAHALLARQVSGAWEGATDGEQMTQTRIFRHSMLHYWGSLHEQVVTRSPGMNFFTESAVGAIEFIHSGYTIASVIEHDKGNRNVEIAKSAFENSTPGTREHAHLLTNYGRSLILAGRSAEGVELLLQLRSSSQTRPGSMILAGRAVLPHLMDSGESEAFEEWLLIMEKHGEAPGRLALAKAQRLRSRDDFQGARDLIASHLASPGASEKVDYWGNKDDLGTLEDELAALEIILGNTDRAQELALKALAERPDTVSIPVLFNILHHAGFDMFALINAAPERFMDRSLRAMTAMDPEVGLAWCTAFHTTRPADIRPVVAGCTIASRTNWLTALHWTGQAMEMGLDLNPLQDFAEDPARSAVERAIAWALLAETFGGDRSFYELVQALEQMETGEQVELLRRLGDYAPNTLSELTSVASA